MTGSQYPVPYSEIKRLQDHAFAQTNQNAEIKKASRRTLRCLHGYWQAFEIDGDREMLWWRAFEFWAEALADLCGGESPA